MNDSIAQLSGRGTVTLPADLRRKLGLRRGDVLAVRLTGGSIVLTPAVVTPVELYTDERIAEFGRNAELAADELAAARRTWDVKAPRRRARYSARLPRCEHPLLGRPQRPIVRAPAGAGWHTQDQAGDQTCLRPRSRDEP